MDNKLTPYKPNPIFEIGSVPNIPHVEIQKKEFRSDGKWYYAIRNNYNPWASGWMDEDGVISEINSLTPPKEDK